MRRKTVLGVVCFAIASVFGTAVVRLDAAAAQVSASPARGASAADAWNTFSADITIRHSRVAADGKPVGEAMPAIQYHWERTLTASGWKSTMTLANKPRVKIQALSGELQLDDPFAIVRIEDEEDGTPLRLFNRKGEQARPPAEADTGLFNPAGGSSVPADASFANGAVRPQTFGREWADSLVALPSNAASRRAALERKHGKAVGRVGGLERFLTTRGAETMEVLADLQSALPVEINTVENGVLVAHTTVGYTAGDGGSLVRRVMRAERVIPGLDGERTVTDVELANVRLERRR